MLEVNIFLDENDRRDNRPMHEYVVHFLMHHQIRGASIFAAMGGYGHKHHLHLPKRIGATDEAPILIVFIDEEEKILGVLPHLKEVIKEGLIVVKEVKVI